ncbi:MAG: ChaN family lipoprotein [Candidatus Cloacimonetes bacterium]|nr:ChaN family lipoprotein [Candidatus Cloacimonadota bacterium]
MKMVLLMIAVLGLCGLFAQEYRIISTATGESISLKQLSKELADYDVVFFGEFHDNELIHELEYQLLSLLHKELELITVSMEMFEQDVQEILNQYLKGIIGDDEFLAESRPWGNFQSDYSAIIEFAKDKELPVIAANVPRCYASELRKKSWESLQKLPKTEKAWFAKELVVLDDEYKKRFTETMKSGMGAKSKMGISAEMIDRFYAAQCLKDDTMAESIALHIKKHPDRKVIHYNGGFHSNAHLGTVQKLAGIMPELKIAVIAPINHKKPKAYELTKEDKSEGDFLLIVLRQE